MLLVSLYGIVCFFLETQMHDLDGNNSLMASNCGEYPVSKSRILYQYSILKMMLMINVVFGNFGVMIVLADIHSYFLLTCLKKNVMCESFYSSSS